MSYLLTKILLKRGEVHSIFCKSQLLLNFGFSRAHGYSTKIIQGSVPISATKEGDRNLKKGQKSIQNILDRPIDTLIPLTNREGNYPKLFFIHGLEGHCLNLKYISSLLQLDSYGLQLAKIVSETSIRDIATQYIREVKKVQPKGPYNICGYSSGATTAFEMIHQLHRVHNDSVSNLIVLDGCLNWELKSLDTTKILMSIMSTFVTDIDKLQHLASALPTLDLSDQFETCSSFLKSEIPDAKKDGIISFFSRITIFWQLLLDHEIADHQYSGATTMIKAAEKSMYFSMLKDQDTYHVKDKCTGPFQVFTVDGDHYSFLSPSKAKETAALINSINFKNNDAEKN